MTDYKSRITGYSFFTALSCALVVCSSGTLFTQSTNNRFLSSGSEIVADVLPGNDIYVSHPCDKGITIYNLAEIFQVTAASVIALNRLNASQPLNSGRIVKIPLQKDLIRPVRSARTSGVNPVPVYYVAKKGESLFRIARTYFDKEVEDIQKINNKKDTNIKEGEKLLLGWYLTRIPQVKENRSFLSSANKPVNPPDTNGNAAKQLESDERNASSIIKYYISDVIGHWDKNSQASSSFFVLHNEAKPGSVMDIYNPMLRRHVKAKVIGKLPTDMYTDDIQIILSGATARELGILDGRFKVNIKFEK